MVFQPDSRGIIAVQINNDNSKYGGTGNAAIIFPKKFGMNPMRGKDEMRRREEPKENTIQVIWYAGFEMYASKLNSL